MTRQPKNKKTFSKWLEKLQQESWQLELIISGLVIYGLLKSLTVIDKVFPSILDIGTQTRTFGLALVLALFILRSSIYIFIINLIIHVLIRSLWIGAIGLRYVSGNINYDQLDYSESFTNYYRKKIGSFDNYIERLENFASVLFAYTFLLFFTLLSLYLYFIWIAFLIPYTEKILPQYAWIATGIKILTIIYLMIGLLVAFDFITLGLLKKVKNNYFSRAYLVIYRFYSFTTLSFLWRPMLLNFLEQAYTRRLFLMIIPYLIFLATVSGFNFVGYGYHPTFHEAEFDEITDIVNQHSFNFSFYEEERNQYSGTYEKQIHSISIPSKKIKGQIGEVFVKAQPQDKWLIHKMDSTLQPLKEEGLSHGFWNGFWSGFSDYEENGEDEEKKLEKLKKQYEGKPNYQQKQDSLLQSFEDAAQLKKEQNFLQTKTILEKSILISIDDRPINPARITCDFYNHPHGKAAGMLCYFPLDSLQNGRHYLQIRKAIGNKNRRTKIISLDTLIYTIPFIYE